MVCLACGPTTSKASSEHVFPNWLLEFLGAKRVSIGSFHRNEDGSRVPYRREIALGSFTLKRICERCNNEWMSRLEERAKPLVKELITGATALEQLDRHQVQILARWAGKTAIVEAHAVGAESPIDGKLLAWMREHEDAAPGRFVVVAAPIDFGGIGHMQVGLVKDLLGGHRETIAANIVVLAFPNLILTCGFPLPEIDYDCRCDLSLYRPLWPDRAAWTAMSMPTAPLSRQEKGLDMLEALAERIELFHRLQ